MFEEDAACILLGVDPDTVVSDDGAGITTTVSGYQELVVLIIVMLRPWPTRAAFTTFFALIDEDNSII